MVNTRPKNALKILQLLLRCGMVCREELSVVLDMMLAVPDGRVCAAEERTGAVPQRLEATQQRKAIQRPEATGCPEAAAPQSGQKTLALELDSRD